MVGMVDRIRWLITGKEFRNPVLDRGGWLPVIRESYPGAWQQNVEVDFNVALSNHALFACVSLASSDIAKLRVKLVEDDNTGIWKEIKNPAYSPVLRKPNHFQNRIQFFESWVLSKLLRGNTYVLKQRDARGVVVKLYVLDPNRVRPLIAADGSIFYELNTDEISSLPDMVLVPAREIIHDRFNCLFHPLVGTSPIFASGLAAIQGLNIQSDSALFFANKSRPGGLLVAPGRIDPAHAATLKTYWQDTFSGANRGKIAVLGDGLKFENLSVTAEDSQLIEQLKWSAEVICSTFHIPPYKIGVGTMPAYNNIQALNVEYYSQCLQRLIEDLEICLDEGLDVGEKIGTEFDLDGLLRMDSVTQMQVIDSGKNILTPNEGRRKLNYPDVAGGNVVYRQQQDFSIEALAKRDAKADPFATSTPAPKSSSTSEGKPPPEEKAFSRIEILPLLKKGFEANAAG